MLLTSPVFKHNTSIPPKYTCDGSNVSPPLEISDVPVNAKSLALIMDDPDIPDFVKQKFGIQVWDHWIVFNIPPTKTKIAEGENPGTKGKGTYPHLNYGGPCPPDREHRYFFKLYALDARLDLPEGSDKKQLEAAMKGHIIEQCELVGRYERG